MTRFYILLAALFSINTANAQTQNKICFTTNGSNCVQVSATNPFPVSATVSATAAGTATAAAPTYLEGTSNPLSLNLAGALRVLATIDTTGLATSALQTTGNSTLTTINSTLGSPIQTTGGTVGLVAGTAIVGKFGIDQTTDGTTNKVSVGNTVTVSGTVTANAGTGTFAISAAALPLPSGASTAALQTTGNSTLTTINTSIGTTNTSLTTINSTLGSPFQAAGALGAGSAIIGKVGVDQTTPGTTNGIQPASAALGVANANTTSPLAVQMMVSDNSVLQRVFAPIVLADGVNGNNMVAAGTWLWNGATWDRSAGDATNGTWVNVKTSVLPTGASTAANQTSVIGTKNAGTAATNSLSVGGVYNSTPLTLTNTQQSSIQLDANGYLKVNVATGGGSGGTSSSFGAAFPATGTAIGASDGTNMVNLLADGSNNLKVNCAVGCAGGTTSNASSGVATSSDNGATVGWLYGFNGTTWDQLQVDASKYLKVAIQNSTLSVTQSGTWNIATVTAVTGITNALPAGSNSIGTVVLGTGSNTIGALTANQSVNMAQVAGTTADTNSGTKSAGTLRVVIATDQPQLTNKLLVTPDANSAVNISQINGVTPLMGNGVTGTGSQRVTIASDNTAFSVNAALVAGTALVGKVGIDQTTAGTTNGVSIAQIGATTVVNGGVAGSLGVGGTVATNVAITANPLNLGAQAVSSENAAVTTARQVQLVADLVGKLIVLPYSNPENFVSGVITSAMTGTTSTSLVAAPASGLRNYITACTFSNAHATVGTDMILQDGSGGTTIWNVPAAAVYGGAHITFPTPLRQPTTATALYVANVTTGASTKAACSGYKGA